MIWKLEAYDTETRRARSRSYTRSERTATLWEQIPRIDFSDSGHGIVFQAIRHQGAREPEIAHGPHAREHLARLKRQRS